MRNRLLSLLALLPFLVGFDGSRAREALDAAFQNLYEPDLLAGVELVMTRESGRRETVTYAMGRKRKGGETRTLVYTPDGRRDGPRVLLFQRPGERDRVFFSQGQHGDVRPMSAGRPPEGLFDSDFGYEDLRSLDVDDYSIEVLGIDTIEGESCRVLRLRPRSGPYLMQLVWLSTSRPVILRSDYFDEAGLWKRYTARPHRIVQHLEWWLPMEDTMLNLRSGSRTVRKLRNVIVDAAVPDGIFTVTRLARGRLPSF